MQDFEDISLRTSLRKKELRVVRFFILLPWIGLIISVALLGWESLRPGPIEVSLLVLGYVLDSIGVEVGYHRLFAHRSFKTHPVVRGMLVVFGAASGDGPAHTWAARHRHHHQHSDGPDDLHSPSISEDGIGARLKGLWHAHIGWQWNHATSMSDYWAVTDLVRDPVVRRLASTRMYFFCVVLGLLCPAVIDGILRGTWQAAGLGFLWGGPLRMIFRQTAFYSVASFCHVFGHRPFRTDDQSGDVMFMALPTFGASWHNTHHAFPYSYTNQAFWWQFDPAGWFINALARVGLAWDLRRPTAAEIRGAIR